MHVLAPAGKGSAFACALLNAGQPGYCRHLLPGTNLTDIGNGGAMAFPESAGPPSGPCKGAPARRALLKDAHVTVA